MVLAFIIDLSEMQQQEWFDIDDHGKCGGAQEFFKESFQESTKCTSFPAVSSFLQGGSSWLIKFNSCSMSSEEMAY